MKSIIFALPIVLFLSSCDNDDVVIDQSKLPAEASVYIQSHFNDVKITQATKSQDGLSKSYDVYLNSGISLEFTRKGKIESIKSIQRLPDNVIPAKILDYVSIKHPSEFITEWEMNNNGQEIKLSNKLELKFNKEGDFIKIDM